VRSRFVLCLCALVMTAVAVRAHEPPPQQDRARRSTSVPGQEGTTAQGVSPAEVQRMFDAYALMQAQEQLKIGDDQFAQFLTRYKALQDLRRKNLQERARLVFDMRQMLNRPNPDETQLKERITALQDLETRSAADVKKAYEAIDQVLDVRQQAKFRVFEEQMERRKLELVTRARQANRPKNQK
jgi:Spy/CpxP family protein refolding chaperone